MGGLIEIARLAEHPMVEQLFAVVGREDDDRIVPPALGPQRGEDPAEMVVGLRARGPRRWPAPCGSSPRPADATGRRDPGAKWSAGIASSSAAASGCWPASTSAVSAADRQGDVGGIDRIGEGRGRRERRMRGDIGQVGAEGRRPPRRRAKPRNRSVRNAVSLSRAAKTAGSPKPRWGEDAAAAVIGIGDRVASGLQMAEPGGGPFGQQRVDREARTDVLVIAPVGVPVGLSPRVERRVGVAEQRRPVAGAPEFGEQRPDCRASSGTPLPIERCLWA